MSDLITLRSRPDALAKSKVKVNRDTGEISGVAILSKGAANGHGFEIDDTMLSQAMKGINAAGEAGLKVHMTHGHAEGNQFSGSADGLLSLVAKTQPDAVIDGGTVRGTVKLLNAAKNSPQGDMRTYLLDLAEEAPEAFGLSIVFSKDQFEQRLGQPPLGRIKEMKGVDFVGDPAGNSNGLLSRANDVISSEEIVMKPEFLKRLGLAEGATPEQIEAAVTALENKAKDAEIALAKKGDVDVEALKKQAADEAVKLEQKRVSDIETLGNIQGIDAAFVDEMKRGGFTFQEAKDKVVEKLAAKRPGVPGSGASVTVTNDGGRPAMLKAAMSDAILLRAGVKVEKPHEEAHRYNGLPLVQLAKLYYRELGVPDADYLSPARVVELLGRRAFQDAYPTITLSQGTSDFSYILTNSMRKSLRQAYMDAPSQWQKFCRRETTPDFKTITRAALSEAPDLQTRQESGEVKYVTLSDGAETYSLGEYIGGVKLTRRAIINDDMSAFGRIPMLQGAAAKRKEDDVAFAILTANAALADSVALFHATHANLISAGGGAPSVTTLAATQTLMRKQRGPNSAAYLELMPKYILVPTELEVATQQLLGSVVDPAKSNSTPNPFANKLEVISSARLSASSSTVWYLVGDYNVIDTIEICFLESEQTPVLQQETDFDTDDVKFKVRHTLAGKAIDFRNMAKNPGA